MVGLILLLQPVPQQVVDAGKILIDYGTIGAVLVLAMAGIVFMYITNNKREKERHELFRQDMQSVAAANRTERERWHDIDSQRFQTMQELMRSHTDATVKNATALEQLGMIIKERVK